MAGSAVAPYEVDDNPVSPLIAIPPTELCTHHLIREFPKVCMGKTPYGERGLFAAVDIRAGEEILRESSFFWELDIPTGDTSIETYFTPSGLERQEIESMLYQMAPYCGITSEPLEIWQLKRSELVQRTLASNSFNITVQAPVVITDDEGAETNEVQSLSGRANFLVICLSNNSCGASASVTQLLEEGAAVADTPPVYIMRARHDIAKGSEITVSYVPRVWKLAARQNELRRVWGFECNCPRCSTAVDDTVVAKCPKCTDGRVYMGKILQCVDCRTMFDDSAAAAGAPDGSFKLVDMANDELMLDLISPDDEEYSCNMMMQRILAHPVLSVEDCRMWLALNAAMQLEDADPDLVAEVQTRMLMAAERTPFVNAHDLQG